VGIEQVSRLLRDSAAEVPAPQLAEAAWAQAVKARRRRQNLLAGTVVAATVAAVSVVVVAVRGGHEGTPVHPQTSPPPTISRTPSVPVDRIPTTLPFRAGGSLPRDPGDLAGSPVLGSGSIRRADALYEPSGGAQRPQPVYVLSGGSFHRLDAGLAYAMDSAKNLSAPLQPTSLSADGRLAAFPQPDEVVVVDLTTAHVTHIKVTGVNEQVLWRTSRSLLVGQQGAVYAVDVEHESATRMPGGLSLGDAAAGASGTVLELPNSAGLPVREWTVGTGAPRIDAKVDQRGLSRYRVADWTGPAWRAGDLLVRAGRSDGPRADMVAVLDARSGRVVRVVAGTATPLGWLDRHTVVLQARNGVLAWDIDTGRLTSIAAPFDGTLALP
jgi:hypothetical protein